MARPGKTRWTRATLWAGAIGVGALAAGAGAWVATYPRWRTWCLTWGAREDEAARTYPGDDLLTEPDVVTTRAIWIDAPPDAVWPWLAQMGPARGGVYTYDWIERILGLDVHSVDVILPEFQRVEVGDAQTLGTDGPTLRVVVCEPDRELVLRSDDGHWVWSFTLEQQAAGTRLFSRNRIAVPGASGPTAWAWRYLMEPGSLIMERKMLIGIKERAEQLARPKGGAPDESGAAILDFRASA